MDLQLNPEVGVEKLCLLKNQPMSMLEMNGRIKKRSPG